MAMEEMSELSINPIQMTQRPDPIAILEQQWQTMLDTIRRLRKENSDLFSQLQERTVQIQQVEYEMAQLKQQVAVLHQEKHQNAARIEDLLARFNELGQTA